MGWDLVVLVAASMLGLQLIGIFMRREHKRELPYIGLMIADLALLVLAHATGRDASLLGKVASSLAMVMVLGPRFIDTLERRAFARDDLGGALRAAKLRELVQPGLASTRRRRQLANFVEARAGGAAAVLQRLDAELGAARNPSEVELLLVERATVLFMAQRYRECAEVTARLPPGWAGEHPVLGAYLVRAHGELGELDQALAVLRAVAGGTAARDPGALPLLAQARLTLLAFAGRQGDVDRLLATEAGLLVSPRARAFLHDVARDRAVLTLPPALAGALDHVAAETAEAARPLVRPRPATRARVTTALIVVNVAAAIASTHLAFHTSTVDLIRAGALFRPAVQAGEWWRGITAMFLHADPLHLGINMYALYLLGRFSEEILGSLRYFVVYFFSGLTGAIGSTFVAQPGLSVGASGAIMGLLGALIVVLILRRGSWPETWRKTLLWNLVLVGALQIYIGFEIPVIDNGAHVGGMLGGAAMALLVAPGGLLGRSAAAKAALVTLTVIFLGGLAWAGVQVGRTSLDDMLRAMPTKEVRVAGHVLEVPKYWELDEEHDVVVDPFLGIQLPGPQPDDPRLRGFVDQVVNSARQP